MEARLAALRADLEAHAQAETQELRHELRRKQQALTELAATVGAMQSQEICDALKDVYLGADPVSPPMKEAALAGVKKM